MLTDDEYKLLKEKSEKEDLSRYEIRQMLYYEEVQQQKYINEILSKSEEDRTDEEQAELDRYAYEDLKWEMTHQF